jgi:hypothetical protein
MRPEWITENAAAEKLRYHPRYFRAMVKERKLAIDYTTIRGRKYQYNLKDIETLLLINSTITK